MDSGTYKLTNGNGFVIINENLWAKGSLRACFAGDQLEVRNIYHNGIIIPSTIYSNYYDSGGTAYASVAALKTAIQTLFFRAE